MRIQYTLNDGRGNEITKHDMVLDASRTESSIPPIHSLMTFNTAQHPFLHGFNDRGEYMTFKVNHVFLTMDQSFVITRAEIYASAYPSW